MSAREDLRIAAIAAAVLPPDFDALTDAVVAEALEDVHGEVVRELNALRFREIAFDGMDTRLTKVVSLDSTGRAVTRAFGRAFAPTYETLELTGVPADGDA